MWHWVSCSSCASALVVQRGCASWIVVLGTSHMWAHLHLLHYNIGAPLNSGIGVVVAPQGG